MKLREKVTILMTLFGTAFSLGAQSKNMGSEVITMTRLPIPWYAPKFLIRSKMKDSIPEYSQIPGLKRKNYSIESETGLFGGIYLWENHKAAKDWFNPEWFARVNKKYGGDNKVAILKSIYLFNSEPKNSEQIVSQITKVFIYENVTQTTKDLITHFESQIKTLQNQPGFVSLWVAQEENSRVHIITVWSDTSSAREYDSKKFTLSNWKVVEEIDSDIPIALNLK